MSSLSSRGLRATIRYFLPAVLLASPAIAHAEWIRAESTNFIAYSESSPDDLRARVAKLEKFGQVLQAMTGARRPKDVPVKITVYFLRTIEDVGNTLPYPSYGVAGYYSTTMRGPFTVMPRQNRKDPGNGRFTGPTFQALQVLQHELTHHFTFQYFTAAYPSWYTEGFADYAGAIEISDDNVVNVGMFMQSRAATLRQLAWVPLHKLMNPIPGQRDFPGIAIYSQGWITVHYLNSSPQGRAMLADYLKRINEGQSFGKALEAFGDIDKLDREVRAYSRRSTLDAVATKYVNLDPGPIDVKALSPLENELVDIQMTLSAGIAASKAQGFARRVRTIVKADPDNPYSRRMLIEAERVAGNNAEATAAIDSWLAAAPSDPWANFFKGDMEIAALAAAKSTDKAAWLAARTRIRAAMKAMPNEPRFARAFYESYSRSGMLPPAVAQNALVHALKLIPNERSLRLMVANDYEARGMIDDALSAIGPLAYGLEDESEKDKRRREHAEDQYKVAEDEDEKETPREMLVRLLKKKADTPPAAQAAPKAE